MKIFVNGGEHSFVEPNMHYEQVVQLAGYEATRVLSVVYATKRNGGQKRMGTLIHGRTTVVEEGMRFTVADTSNA